MKVDGSKTGLVLAGIVFVGLAGVSAKAAGFQGLGDLPGGSFYCWAWGVSADGSVVVGRSSSASGGEAFRWEGGEMAGLGDLPGGSFGSYAYGVSADGLVVVGGSKSGGEAFRWTDLNGNGLADPNEKLDYHPEFGLGDLPGGSFGSRAWGVSADGSVVVGRSRSASGGEAFRWTDLNGNGLVDPNEKLDYHPEFGLGDLPGGGFESWAFGVSADGSVVVGHSFSASGYEAFRWTQATGMVGLGDLPGGEFWSEACDASADGSVVVGVSESASGYGFRAFIWDATNGMRNLKDVLENDFGLDLTGWTLFSAEGISDDGLTIVGWGSNNPSGYTDAWIATLTCDYNLAGDMNDDCRVELTDFAQLGTGWQISYYMLDLKEMAGNWLINCSVNPSDPACIPR